MKDLVCDKVAPAAHVCAGGFLVARDGEARAERLPPSLGVRQHDYQVFGLTIEPDHRHELLQRSCKRAPNVAACRLPVPERDDLEVEAAGGNHVRCAPY